MKSEKASRSEQEIVLERLLPHPPEQVWQALTDPKALSQWLLPTNFQPKLGHRFRFTGVSPSGKRRHARCQVVELDAPRRIAYTWQDEAEDAPTLVTWTLEAIAEGVCLRLEHTRPASFDATSPTNSAFVVGRLADFLRFGGARSETITRRYSLRVSAVASLPRRQRGHIALSSSASPLRCMAEDCLNHDWA